MTNLSPKERFLAAAAGKETDRPPVWLMRQAGRYLPEYRAVKAKHPTKEMMQTPELACEITLQPVDILGVDAAILYSDILMIPDAMGMGLSFAAGEGPAFEFPVDGDAALNRLNVKNLNERLHYVFEAIRLCLSKLPGGYPLLGFAGAPFTVACYMIAGKSGKHFHEAKRLAWQEPGTFHALMDVLTRATIDYLLEQANAGVAAVQLFDTWAGLLSAEDYREFAKPYAARVFEALEKNGVPSIYYVKGGDYLLDEMKDLRNGVIGVDWRVNLGNVRERTGNGFAIQGNFDPDLLTTSPERIEARLKDMLAAIPHPRKGYIVNLGHGVEQHTPVENVKFFVKKAQELGAK